MPFWKWLKDITTMKKKIMYSNLTNNFDICFEYIDTTSKNINTEINGVQTVCSYCIDDSIDECIYTNQSLV